MPPPAIRLACKSRPVWRKSSRPNAPLLPLPLLPQPASRHRAWPRSLLMPNRPSVRLQHYAPIRLPSRQPIPCKSRRPPPISRNSLPWRLPISRSNKPMHPRVRLNSLQPMRCRKQPPQARLMARRPPSFRPSLNSRCGPPACRGSKICRSLPSKVWPRPAV